MQQSPKEVDGKSHLQNDIFEKPSKEISIVARYVVQANINKFKAKNTSLNTK